jgi:hypothetical protein
MFITADLNSRFLYFRYLQAIDTAYKMHYRTRREESESSEESEDDSDDEEMEAVNTEETELDPDEEFHIPEAEEADEDFDTWFTRVFPPVPAKDDHARGIRRRRLGLMLNANSYAKCSMLRF